MAALLSPQIWFAALLTGALYALIGLGLNLVYGTTRMLNVAHGEIVMLGSYATWGLFVGVGVSPWVALLVVPLIAFGVGLGVYRVLLVPVMRSSPVPERVEANSLLVFFGLSVILQNVVALALTNSPRAYQYLDDVVRLGPVGVTANRLVAVTVTVLAVLAILLTLARSWLGAALRALMQSRDVSTLLGIPVNRIHGWCVGLGFALAALAGSLVSTFEPIGPFMGFGFTAASFVVVILGGLGNLRGGLIAGLVLGVLETVGVALVGPSYRSLLIYGAFILVLTLRFSGLRGQKA